VLVIDEGSKKILDNVVKEDDILNENIASTWHAGLPERVLNQGRYREDRGEEGNEP
jgi:hypothetical protein